MPSDRRRERLGRGHDGGELFIGTSDKPSPAFVPLLQVAVQFFFEAAPWRRNSDGGKGDIAHAVLSALHNPISARARPRAERGTRGTRMDKPSFGCQSVPAKANHTDGGDLSTYPATAPAEDDDLDEIKSAVLAKLALDLGKDASVATDRDWFVAAALTV